MKKQCSEINNDLKTFSTVTVKKVTRVTKISLRCKTFKHEVVRTTTDVY